MRLVIAISFVFFSALALAQEAPRTAMFWNDYSRYNPSNSGFSNRLFVSGQAKTKWTGDVGFPRSRSVLADVELDDLNSGVGINYTYKHYENRIEEVAQLNYAYHFTIREEHQFALGASIGLSDLRFTDEKNGSSRTIDAAIPGNASARIFPTSFGASYRFKELVMGWSLTNANQPTYHLSGANFDFDYVNDFSIVGMASCSIPLGSAIDVLPAIFYRSDLIVKYLDVNMRTVYKKKFWMGATCRDILGQRFVMAGMTMGNWNMGYAYRSNAHEAYLTFALR